MKLVITIAGVKCLYHALTLGEGAAIGHPPTTQQWNKANSDNTWLIALGEITPEQGDLTDREFDKWRVDSLIGESPFPELIGRGWIPGEFSHPIVRPLPSHELLSQLFIIDTARMSHAINNIIVDRVNDRFIVFADIRAAHSPYGPIIETELYVGRPDVYFGYRAVTDHVGSQEQLKQLITFDHYYRVATMEVTPNAETPCTNDAP